MKAKKIAVWVAAILVVLLAGGWLYVRHLARKGLPDYSADVVLKGVTGTVTVYRDEHAVPHIYADNEPDLYLATGYVMAQDRLWQMDLIRHVTQGRLSEIFGADLVDTDLLMRSLRIPEKSRRILGGADRNMKAALEAFADGVNQYIAAHKDNLPVEFSLLGYVPEEWKAEHSLNLVGYMAWDLTMPWQAEMVFYKLREKLGVERSGEIVPDIPGYGPVIYPEFASSATVGQTFKSLADAARPLSSLCPPVFQGSNNWAVSGKRSVTGKPILANDMHLGLFAPGIWMQMHQVIKGKLNVTGAVLPGQPCVISGHNDRIAWGMTNVMVDDMDFYLEKTNQKNANEYLYNGAWRKMEVRKEKILIKGGKAVEKEIRFTHRGPVISDFKKVKGAVISMRWIGNDYSDELRTVYLLNRAKNWDEFRNAARTFISTSQNIVYADVDGNIGLYCCAGVPIRKKGDGLWVSPGWTDEYDWQGTVPFERLPHVFNPVDGAVSSANNKTVGGNYPHHISHWFDSDYRIRRIREMLREKEKHSIESFRRMHADQHSKLADDLKGDIVAVVKKAKNLSPVEEKAASLLASWDSVLAKDSAAAALFDQCYLQLMKNIFADEMGEELYQEFISSQVLVSQAIERLWRNPASAWFDDVATSGVREGFEDVVLKSFKEAVKALDEAMGGDPGGWKWGKIHTLVLEHPMGSVKVLDRLFCLNRGPFPVGGSFHTVCPYAYDFPEPFHANMGASQRHIFSTANWDDSLTVIPTGNSGIPASDYYCDQSELYVNNEYHRDYVSRPLVEKTAKYTMKITGK